MFTELRTEIPGAVQDAQSLEQLSEAVDALAVVDARLAQTVDLKFFCGFSFSEIAGLMDVSDRTAKRDWDKARIFLRRHLQALNLELPAIE